jgi:hypothetical protein
MTLSKAIMSGKRYRQKYSDIWHEPNGAYRFSTGDIISDDWEVEEDKVEISLSQLTAACYGLRDSDGYCSLSTRQVTELAQILGFK